MKRAFFLMAFSWLPLAAALAAPAVDLRQDPAWRDTFQRLAPVQDRQCSFQERRYFPFRRKPIELSGIVRLAPDRGLSLQYLAPEARIVIIDRGGVLLREGGVQRAAPADHRVQAATGVMAAVMRFDPDELARDFTWAGARAGDAWRLTLQPRDPTLAGSLGEILVSGMAGRLAEIDLVRSADQRIEIVLGPPADGVAFTAAELGRYFR
jgi:hypothetical protein